MRSCSAIQLIPSRLAVTVTRLPGSIPVSETPAGTTMRVPSPRTMKPFPRSVTSPLRRLRATDLGWSHWGHANEVRTPPPHPPVLASTDQSGRAHLGHRSGGCAGRSMAASRAKAVPPSAEREVRGLVSGSGRNDPEGPSLLVASSSPRHSWRTSGRRVSGGCSRRTACPHGSQPPRSG
jgi:hypothetical protein